MSTQWQTEAELPPYTDTTIGKPLSLKVKGQGTQGGTLPKAHVNGNGVRSTVTIPVGGETPHEMRVEIPPQTRQVEWEHIRTQLGTVQEERRSDREGIREPGLSDGDEGFVSLLKKFGQACLVLLTAPFMLCYGVFELTGALFGGVGKIFTGLAKLSKMLVYWPRKRKSKHAMQAGPTQV